MHATEGSNATFQTLTPRSFPYQVVMLRWKIPESTQRSRCNLRVVELRSSAGTLWKKEMAPIMKGTWMKSLPCVVFRRVWSAEENGMSPEPKWLYASYAGVFEAPMNSSWPVPEPGEMEQSRQQFEAKVIWFFFLMVKGY